MSTQLLSPRAKTELIQQHQEGLVQDASEVNGQSSYPPRGSPVGLTAWINDVLQELQASKSEHSSEGNPSRQLLQNGYRESYQDEYEGRHRDWFPFRSWRGRRDMWGRYRFRGAMAMFNEYQEKDVWERDEDRMNYLRKICNTLPDELPEAFLRCLETRPWMFKRYKQLKKLCDFLDLMEEADGVVRVVLDGKITITVIADGDTCDVEVSADVQLTTTIDGEAEGLYAFIAAEVIGRAICSDKAQGSGVFVLRVHAQATLLSLDGQCHTDVINEIVAETVIVGEGIGGSVDSALAFQAGCDGSPENEQIILTEVVGHVNQGEVDNGQAYADVGFNSEQLAVGGRKMLLDKQQAALSQDVLEVLKGIVNQQEISATWLSLKAMKYLETA